MKKIQIKGIRLDRFRDGKPHAITMSYDDGKLSDRKLVELFNRYGIRGTFHLNSGRLGDETYITEKEVQSLYANHEVAGHSINHPYLERLSMENLMWEIQEDRRHLEELTGEFVQGFSYPYGTWNDQVKQALVCAGYHYSRTTQSTGRFDLPEDFMEWHPTCHHKENLLEMAELFLERTKKDFTNMLFYVWGHSYEFEKEQNWDLMERFCEMVGGRDDVWYAANGEIYGYLQAVKRLQFSADRTMIYNPSAIEVWFSIDGETVSVLPGRTFQVTEE